MTSRNTIARGRRDDTETGLTFERVREVLAYDPTTGFFQWRVPISHLAADAAAGHQNQRGYVDIRVDGKQYKAHRLAWLWMTGEWPTNQIDHINRVRHDNRWTNLREATAWQNNDNKINSGHHPKGTWPTKWGWRAQIKANGAKYHLGYFKTAEEAHAAYLAKAIELFGEFARAA